MGGGLSVFYNPLSVFYNLSLALWIGGMAIFTFIVTPAIFKSYGRDKAGEIVGRLFPGYFLYKLVLSSLALVFFLAQGLAPTKTRALPLSLLVFALLLNAFHRFLLYPAISRVKKTVPSFEANPESAARKKFGRLHGVSMALNLAVLAAGIVLFILAPRTLP
ncbi:MAG: DUF4149 domain-containing protein [Nitrospiraceae bacterium]|nr:DUF4149 domain-containing protein [Nitrospiraceae bacterium]